ncbi:MAG TPA: hypothetical protein VMH00_14955 [Candidatus Limnocylindrales bacterium]|nr:hypothetical protein [Candidatus Limnocylindrales bacterium]
MPLSYRTGEEIRKGDRITYHGEEGEIELVADPGLEDTSSDEHWYVREYGGGILIREPKAFGRVFLRTTDIGEDEDLVFVSRAMPQTGCSPQNG